MQYADFQKFAEEVDKQLPLLNEEEDIDNILNRFNNVILEAAHKHVRKVGKARKDFVPYLGGTQSAQKQ
jgi:hypothetical protein